MAAGGSDFCLTSVNHYLRARAQSGDLPARFVSALVQRSPMAAIVAADSPFESVDDLGGSRVGGKADNSMVQEYAYALASRGLAPPVAVPTANTYRDLPNGEYDAVPEYIDTLPRVRRQSGIPVRAVPLGLPFYSHGLVAADRLPDDEVAGFHRAVVAALDHQREHPTAGLDQLAERYPDADPADALEGWSLAEPNIFPADEPVGSSDPDRWAATIDFVATVHGLTAPALATVYRPAVIDLSPVR